MTLAAFSSRLPRSLPAPLERSCMRQRRAAVVCAQATSTKTASSPTELLEATHPHDLVKKYNEVGRGGEGGGRVGTRHPRTAYSPEQVVGDVFSAFSAPEEACGRRGRRPQSQSTWGRYQPAAAASAHF